MNVTRKALRIANERTPQLRMVEIKVRPFTSHPLFWSVGFCILQILLFDESIEGARDRAFGIIEKLPFEVVGHKCRVSEVGLEKPGRDLRLVKQAMQLGFSFRLIALDVGADEGDLPALFEGADSSS